MSLGDLSFDIDDLLDIPQLHHEHLYIILAISLLINAHLIIRLILYAIDYIRQK